MKLKEIKDRKLPPGIGTLLGKLPELGSFLPNYGLPCVPTQKLCRFLGRESFKLLFGNLFEGKTRKWQQLRGLQRLGHILEAWSEPQIHVGTTLFGRNHKNRGLVLEKL